MKKMERGNRRNCKRKEIDRRNWKEPDRGNKRTNEREQRLRGKQESWPTNQKNSKLQRMYLPDQGRGQEWEVYQLLVSSEQQLLTAQVQPGFSFIPNLGRPSSCQKCQQSRYLAQIFFSLSKIAWIIHPQIFLLLHKKYPVGSVNQG